MRILAILLLLSNLCIAQITGPTYLRVADKEVIFCGATIMRMVFNKSEVSIETPQSSVHLKVVSRSRESWTGVDASGNDWIITAISLDNKPGIDLKPKNPELIGMTIHPSKNLCE
jgi:hypothetical protein